MSRQLILAASLLFVLSPLAHADSADDVKAAAHKLADSANYSWKTNVEGGYGAGASEGKTQKDGFTQLHVTLRDNTVEVIMKGDKAERGDKALAAAVKLQEGWQSLSEVTAAAGDAGQPNPGRFVDRMVQNFKKPAAQAEELAGKAKDLQKSEDAYAGSLSEEAVKELMTFGRRGGANANPPQISNAKGRVKFWMKDGLLSKMELNVQGSVSFNGQDRDINRTTTTEIKDVGTTKIEVPGEAMAKLGAVKP
jgi:hypothetical protein